MKYKILILVLIVTGAMVIGFAQNPKKGQAAKPAQKTELKAENVKAGDGHAQLPVDCKRCHSCDFPTKQNPCLNNCPRGQMITVEHKPEEGPDAVALNQNGKQYGKVAFSHKLHAEMSEMSGGCGKCHHYNLAGPIQKCSACHSETRKREDVTRPDLKGAMHRQCYTCHRQWSHANDCKYCHEPKKSEDDNAFNNKLASYKGKSHPEYAAQPKVVYETNAKEGKVVTFYHDEHVKLFGLKCQNCHKNDNCTKCHDVNNSKLIAPKKNQHKGQNFDQIHQNCNSCHKGNSCVKCHSGAEKERFNHLAATGFDLSRNHSKVACDKCHKKNNPMDKPNRNCVNCHSNFTSGKFDHSKTGLKLDDNHKDLDCDNCHKNNNFSKPPVCADCHDDKSYPKFKPGKMFKSGK